MDNPTSPLTIFIAASALSSVAGFAALLRSGKPVTWLSATSSMMNSGLAGLAIATLWYKKHESDVYFLIGLCILSGLAGSTVIDYMLDVLRKHGVSILGVKIDDDT